MKFFSQRDPRWSYLKLGKSPCTVYQYGCTTSCIADGGTYYGEEIDPGQLSKRLEYTSTGLLLWQSIGKVFKRMQFFWRFYTHDEKLISEALKHPNKVVLLNVDRGKHWVFLLGKVPLLGYRCMDPWAFPTKVRYYKGTEVSGGAVLIKK